MYEPDARQYPNLAFLLPAFAAAATSDMAAFAARHFAELAVGADETPVREPGWATPNAIKLELKTMRLRDFSTESVGVPTLLCAPFALHGAAITDFAPGHSLVAALRQAGLLRVFVTDWRSADGPMHLLTIDDYLAQLNVAVDEIGPPVDLIGLCQGGWMSLVYAARFPEKVRKLVLAGAPVDLTAASSSLSELADRSPLPWFRQLIKIGDGRVPGRKVMKFWGTGTVESSDAHRVLQTQEPADSAAFAALEALFREWYAFTLDLPGPFFLEVVEKLYRRNELAAGAFVALGQRVDLKNIAMPMFLLAARDDELVAPPQLFATEQLVATPAHSVRKLVIDASHVSLFMGQSTLNEIWPGIVRWLKQPTVTAMPRPAPAIAARRPQRIDKASA
jgi:poly(3-hydroxybutyrate) depolymerase